MKNTEFKNLAKGHHTRQMEVTDFNGEIKWYTDKFCMKMDGTSLIDSKAWCAGIGYGWDFAKALWESIQAVTYKEGAYLRIDWDKTEF